MKLLVRKSVSSFIFPRRLSAKSWLIRQLPRESQYVKRSCTRRTSVDEFSMGDMGFSIEMTAESPFDV